MICVELSMRESLMPQFAGPNRCPRNEGQVHLEKAWSSCRVCGFFTVARLQSSDYDFAGAKKTIKLIDDPADSFTGL